MRSITARKANRDAVGFNHVWLGVADEERRLAQVDNGRPIPRYRLVCRWHVRVGVRNLHRPAAFRSEPQVVITVFGDIPDLYIAQTLSRCVSAKREAFVVPGVNKDIQSSARSHPEPSVGRLKQRADEVI